MVANTWRSALERSIKEYYTTNVDEWSDIVVSTAGLLNLTVVSERFVGIPLPQRREDIQQFLHEHEVPLPTGFLSLYTPQEATSIGLTQPLSTEEGSINSWYDLASWSANVSERPARLLREQRVPRTVAFYSFKGGVGRTTALTHVAWILAMRGRKVVIVDLDLEAPGLSFAINLSSPPRYGIVDYFFERSYLPQDVEPTISIAEIFGEVRIPDATGRLFVVPAGFLSLDYIAKVDDLRSAVITERGASLWSTFFNEIKEQLQPDIILVDSRTGINEWGAFSLLRAADKAIIFLYPNEQNRHGIDLLLKALAGAISFQLVFSPVPFGESGVQKVEEYWSALKDHLDINADQSNSDIEDEIQSESNATQSEDAEPLTIQYLTELALAPNYPVQALLSHYMNIANVVDEDVTAISLATILTHADKRWKIVESLEFPEVDATTNQNLGDLFQRTRDFNQFLNDTTCLIRGRKGTGKSALYWLLLNHEKVAKELSNRRLDSVRCLSGHGRFRGRPTRDEFAQVDQSLREKNTSWEAFWRTYLLFRLHVEGQLVRILQGLKDTRFTQLRSLLNNKIPKIPDGWQSDYIYTLLHIAQEQNLLINDLLVVINDQLRKNGQVFWFLYDDLDQDLPEAGGVRKRALVGLFQLVQACDARRLKSIGFKIFLREDIWTQLIFDNKSHFNGRDIILQWTRTDFLRLALRQALQSKEFEDLVSRFSPVGNIDQADEATIVRALQLLWGSRREPNLKSKQVSRWVYDRLTDSSNTTFPRSLNILLREARNHELATYKAQSSPPEDRLLRPKSLNEGLIKASEQRCQEVREEYPELNTFFDSIVGSNVLISRGNLRKLWEETVRKALPEFNEFRNFVDFLSNVGLIERAELREKDYRFAEIYAHGFKMYRGTRKM